MLGLRNAQTNPLGLFHSEMDRLFNDFWRGHGSSRQERYPALNVWEDKDHFYVEAEVPGLKMDDLEITAIGRELTIKGERKIGESDEGTTYHRRERGAGKFSRTLRLPTDIAGDGAEASLTNGVLNITLPKPEAVKPRRIEVKALPMK